MAYNHMHVVICKMLAYVYDCMKRGIEVDTDVLMHDSLGIPKPYWEQIVRELVDRGYLSGVSVRKTTSGDSILFSNPRVTLDGVEFLMENGMMAKAARVVADAGDLFSKVVLPFV